MEEFDDGARCDRCGMLLAEDSRCARCDSKQIFYAVRGIVTARFDGSIERSIMWQIAAACPADEDPVAWFEANKELLGDLLIMDACTNIPSLQGASAYEASAIHASLLVIAEDALMPAPDGCVVEEA